MRAEQLTAGPDGVRPGSHLGLPAVTPEEVAGAAVDEVPTGHRGTHWRTSPSSASSRSLPRARETADFTVPTDTPSTSAVWASLRSS